LQSTGSEGLPLTTVDGAAVLAGRYPNRTELLQLAGFGDASAVRLVPEGAALLVTTGTAGCCGGTGCC
jgi:hypothetical protein